jgi:hypothetical protein
VGNRRIIDGLIRFGSLIPLWLDIASRIVSNRFGLVPAPETARIDALPRVMKQELLLGCLRSNQP